MAFHTLVHPGPIYPERIISMEGKLCKVEIPLKKGEILIEAISKVLEPMGITGAGIRFEGLKLFPMKYVMPTYAKDDTHVAYYSDTHTAEKEIRIFYGNATYGIREDVPFMHFHGLWMDEEELCGGHIHAFASAIAEDSVAVAYGSTAVEVNSMADAETNFTVFMPQQKAVDEIQSGDEVLVTAVIKPNEDLVTAIEEICEKHQLTDVVIRSGVGSTVGGIFEDGNIVEEIPTELLVLEGTTSIDESGKHELHMNLKLIDASGVIHEGVLAKAQNPVLILFELFVTGRKL